MASLLTCLHQRYRSQSLWAASGRIDKRDQSLLLGKHGSCLLKRQPRARSRLRQGVLSMHYILAALTAVHTLLVHDTHVIQKHTVILVLWTSCSRCMHSVTLQVLTYDNSRCIKNEGTLVLEQWALFVCVLFCYSALLLFCRGAGECGATMPRWSKI